MMKKIFFMSVAICLYMVVTAQDAKQLQQSAREYMHKGDYANAILVLNRVLVLEPNNLEAAKDLGLNYYYAKDYKKSVEVLNKLLDRDDADDQCFQIAGDAYWAMDMAKESEAAYRKGIKKLPNSGALYNELGKVLWTKQDFSAIKQWEKGIENDPGFAGNYYNACKYYYFTTDKTWSLIYGEIFLNIDPLSAYTPEVKNILLEGYKKLFADADLEKNYKEKNAFTLAFLKTMNKQSSVAASGINAASLTMIRTRFILDWYAEYASKFPFRLFDLQKQFIEAGLFEAYNQWIFATAQNLPAYQAWTAAHNKEYTELNHFMQGRIFRIPKGQYYH